MERVSDDKRYKLVNRQFSIEARDGRRLDERTLGTVAELQKAFEETFNVVPPVPVEQVFSRLPP
jgi:hypothetical protein